MDAQQIINKEYHGARNFMTPHVLYVKLISPNRAVELSTGKGIFTESIYGVSIVDYDSVTNTTTRRTDLSGCYESRYAAENYINQLMNESDEQED